MAGLAKSPGNKIPIIHVMDKSELIKRLNTARPEDTFFDDCKKAATIFEEVKGGNHEII